MPDPDPTIIASALGAIGTAAGGLFGWLRGKNHSQRTAEELFLARIADLETRCDNLAESIERRREERAGLESELAAVRAEVASLRAELADVQGEREELSTRLNEAEGHVQALQAQVEALGQVPTPAPPRSANGRFASKKKGRKQ